MDCMQSRRVAVEENIITNINVFNFVRSLRSVCFLSAMLLLSCAGVAKYKSARSRREETGHISYGNSRELPLYVCISSTLQLLIFKRSSIPYTAILKCKASKSNKAAHGAWKRKVQVQVQVQDDQQRKLPKQSAQKQ